MRCRRSLPVGVATIAEDCPGPKDEQDQTGAASFWPKGPSGPQLRSGDLQLKKGRKGQPAYPKAKKALEKVPTEMEGERKVKGTGFYIGEGKHNPSD